MSPSRSPAFVTALGVLLAAFAWPLYELTRFSIGHELYSHIVLIPLISLYLVWQRRTEPVPATPPIRVLAVVFAGLGMASAGAFAASRIWATATPDDSLALATIAFLLCLGAVCSWFLGRARLRALAFPLLFLVFMIPLPVAVLSWVEFELQRGSAAVAHGLFSLAGTTVYVEQLVFQLPGITIEVAPECSGIHSSLALLITSVLAGYYFLTSPTRRTILALAVIPLALLRNGFRVFVIGELCVRIGPEMINSYIHRRGGPIFFVLSLVPFFLLLLFLVRTEHRARRSTQNPGANSAPAPASR